MAIWVGNLPIWAVMFSMFSARSPAIAVAGNLAPAIFTRRIVSSVAVLTMAHAAGDIYTCCEILWSYSWRMVAVNSLWKRRAVKVTLSVLRIKVSGDILSRKRVILS